MFKYSDKVTLTADNAINREGEVIDYVLSFPINEDDFYLPQDIIQISIYEYHEEIEVYKYESFKICVGDITSLNEIRDSKEKKVKFRREAIVSLDDLDDELCYFKDDNNMNYVFAKINNGDIVVKDVEELKDVLIFISRRFDIIKNEMLKIREYTKEKDVIESEEDDEYREKRMKMCIKQRKINNGGNYV